MEKPKKLTREAKEYIEWLEKRLKKYDASNTVAIMYVGVNKMAKEIGKVMYDNTIDSKILTDKDDKQFDRITKFAEKSKSLGETLIYFQEKLDPDVIKEVEQEAGSLYEEIMSGIKDAGA